MLLLFLELLFFCFLPFTTIYFLILFYFDSHSKTVIFISTFMIILSLMLFFTISSYQKKRIRETFLSENGNIKALVSFGTPTLFFYDKHESAEGVKIEKNFSSVLSEFHFNNYDVIITDFVSGLREISKDFLSNYYFTGLLTNIDTKIISLKHDDDYVFDGKETVLTFENEKICSSEIFKAISEKSYFKNLKEKNFTYKSLQKTVEIFEKACLSYKEGKPIDKEYDYDFYIIPDIFFVMIWKKYSICLLPEYVENFEDLWRKFIDGGRILIPQDAIFINKKKVEELLKKPENKKKLDNFFTDIFLRDFEIKNMELLLSKKIPNTFFNKNIDFYERFLEKEIGVDFETIENSSIRPNFTLFNKNDLSMDELRTFLNELKTGLVSVLEKRFFPIIDKFDNLNNLNSLCI